MADLFQASGGVIGTMQPGTSWAAPNGLFPTTDRNDNTAYSWASSTSRITLPSSDLADGYLIVAGFEFHDQSNGRLTPVCRFTQVSGTGNFVTGYGSGYNRDSSEDRAYASCWGFIDTPSASAVIDFQWSRDADAPGATDGTVRSYFQVIPFWYNDIGLYSSTSTQNLNGTTPVLVTGFTGTDGTNISISSNQVTVTEDNKRFLCLGSGYCQGVGSSRTQRWFGFEIDGTFDHSAKGCAFIRNSSNDRGAESFMKLIETDTASRTLEINGYRGDGVSAGQGGADVDGGGTVTAGAYGMVVIELHDDTEVFASVDSVGTQDFAVTGPVDVDIASTGDIEFSDAASFVRATDIAVNCEVAMDVFAFANVSHAKESSISSGSRWTVHGEFTIDGVEQTGVAFHGNYNRGNQSTQDCHGSSTNQAGFFAMSADEDIGVSNQELSGTEGGGGLIETQPGWVGFGLINIDTLEPSGGGPTTATGTITFSGDLAGVGRKPDVDAHHWRWSDDDNASHESTTFLAAEDTTYEVPLVDLGTGFNLIFKLYNNGGGGPEQRDFRLQYNKNSGGWNDVDASSSNVRAFNGQDSDFANSTTERLSDPGGSWQTSRYYESGLSTLSFGNSSMFEFYYCIEFRSADNVGGESYEFRIILEPSTDTVGYDTVGAAVCTIEAGTVTAAGTITMTGDLVADGKHLSGGTTTFAAELAGIGHSLVFAVGTITITGDLVSRGTTNAYGTIIWHVDAISEGVHAAFAVVTFLGELTGASGAQRSAGTSAMTGDLVAAIGTHFVLAAGTITVTGDLVCAARHTGITATTTMIGDLAGIGTSLGGVVTANGNITFHATLAGDGKHLAGGALVWDNDLSALGTQFDLAVATSTMIGDLTADGIHLAHATITWHVDTISEAIHLASGTITMAGDLGVPNVAILATGTSTITGDLAAIGNAQIPNAHVAYYRWADDDNVAHESTTFLAAEDTQYEVQIAELDTGFYLVCKMFNDGVGSDEPDFQLEYNVDGGGWNDVDATSSNVRAFNGQDSDFASGVPERLSDPGGAYQNSKVTEQGIVNLNIGSNFQFEFYYCVEFRSADLSGGESIQFRITQDDVAITHDSDPVATIESTVPFPYHVIKKKRNDPRHIMNL